MVADEKQTQGLSDLIYDSSVYLNRFPAEVGWNFMSHAVFSKCSKPDAHGLCLFLSVNKLVMNACVYIKKTDFL